MFGGLWQGIMDDSSAVAHGDGVCATAVDYGIMRTFGMFGHFRAQSKILAAGASVRTMSILNYAKNGEGSRR